MINMFSETCLHPHLGAHCQASGRSKCSVPPLGLAL
jgi:hypothetical protein